jgi:hypothetical protein
VLSIEDCIVLSGLADEEIAAIAEHEHIPRIVALELGRYILCGPNDEKRIRRSYVTLKRPEIKSMPVKTIRLELARTPEFPEGRADCGYELVAPLKEDGTIDRDAWRRQRNACTVRRFWTGQKEERGVLAHGRNGWYFDYDVAAVEDDEPLFRLDRHVFKIGEYVSVTEHDKVQRTFRVASIR